MRASPSGQTTVSDETNLLRRISSFSHSAAFTSPRIAAAAAAISAYARDEGRTEDRRQTDTGQHQRAVVQAAQTQTTDDRLRYTDQMLLTTQ